jgi:hypothetical protein
MRIKEQIGEQSIKTMYCVIVVNQSLIPILQSNIPSNHGYFVGFKSYFCKVKMRLGNTVIDCQKKEISCFLCLEDLVSDVELILEREEEDMDEYRDGGGNEDNWDGGGKKRDFYIELRFAHDPNQYDKPVLFDEQGFVPYCNIYDVTANNNDKNVIAHVSRYAGILSVRMVDAENRTMNT